MPRRSLSVLPTVFIVLALTGCATELKVQRYFDSTHLPTAGAPYSLSFTQYEITVTRRLTTCSSEGDPADPDPEKRKPKAIDLKIGLKADIKSAEARDPMRNYVVDLESLNSFFKTTSATVAYYDSGAIKSLNASAEDKTGEFIASVAGTFSKLIDAGVAGPGLLEQGQEERGCSADTKKKLATLDSLEAEIEKRSARVDELTGELTKLSAVLLTSKEFSSKDEREKLGELKVKLIEEMSKLVKATKKTEPLLKELSENKKINWPNDGETFATTAGNPAIPDLDQKLFDSWLTDDTTKPYHETKGDTALYKRLAAASAVHLKLQPADKMGRTTACGQSCPDDAISGFKYRIPTSGQLLVCADTVCGEKAVHNASDVGMISQLGHVYVLPLKSAMFSTKTVSATFAENGTPTSIGVTAAASSDKAATTLAAIGDLAITTHKTRSEKELNDLKAKTDLLKAQKEYADAAAVLQSLPGQSKLDATNAFKIDTDLLNANVAYLNAQKALDDAKKAQAASTP